MLLKLPWIFFQVALVALTVHFALGVFRCLVALGGFRLALFDNNFWRQVFLTNTNNMNTVVLYKQFLFDTNNLYISI